MRPIMHRGVRRGEQAKRRQSVLAALPGGAELGPGPIPLPWLPQFCFLEFIALLSLHVSKGNPTNETT